MISPDRLPIQNEKPVVTDICQRSLKFNDYFFKNVVDILKNNNNITRIDLSRNYLDKDCLLVLMPLIVKQPVEVINFEDQKLIDGISDDGAVVLAKYLPQCTSLRILKLGRNGITNKGCALIAHALPASLKELYLDGNIIGTRGLIPLIQSCKRLQLDVLNLSDLKTPFILSGLFDHISRFKVVFDGLKNSLFVNKLFFNRCNLVDDEIFCLLAESVIINKKVHELHISGNNIGIKGIKELIKACVNSPIKVLNLSEQGTFAGIGDEGLIEICNNLKPTMCLEELYLDNNSITDKSIKVLGEKLKQVKLKKVSLSKNKISCNVLRSLIYYKNVSYYIPLPTTCHIEITSCNLSQEDKALLLWEEIKTYHENKNININFSKNDIKLRDGWFKHLIEHFGQIKDLQSLSLLGLNVSDELIDLVKSVVRKQKYLNTICLSRYLKLKPFLVNEILDLVDRNESLREIDLQADFYCTSGYEEITKPHQTELLLDTLEKLSTTLVRSPQLIKFNLGDYILQYSYLYQDMLRDEYDDEHPEYSYLKSETKLLTISSEWFEGIKNQAEIDNILLKILKNLSEQLPYGVLQNSLHTFLTGKSIDLDAVPSVIKGFFDVQRLSNILWKIKLSLEHNKVYVSKNTPIIVNESHEIDLSLNWNKPTTLK